MDILTALNWRYAVREFSPELVAEEKLTRLLEATRLSASSYGLQPYKFIVVIDKATREALLEHSYGQRKVLQSSHLIVLAAQTQIGDDMVERYINQVIATRGVDYEQLQGYADHMKSAIAVKSGAERQAWAREQVYIALGTLLTAAAVEGIDTCPMTGFNSTGYDQVLELPEMGLSATAICAVGKRADTDQAAQQAKVRYPYEDMVLRR